MASAKTNSTKKKSSGTAKKSSTGAKKSSGSKNTRSTSSNNNKNYSSSSKKKTAARKGNSSIDFAWQKEVLLFVILAFCIILFISNLGKAGTFGAALSGFFFGVFGILNYPFPVLLFFLLAFVIANGGFGNKKLGAISARAVMKIIAGIIMFLFLCVFAHLVYIGAETPELKAVFELEAVEKAGGGVVGAIIGEFFVKILGILLAYIIDIVLLIVSVVLLTEKSFFEAVAGGSKKVYTKSRDTAERRRIVAAERAAAKERAEERKLAEKEAFDREMANRRMGRKITGVSMDTALGSPLGTADDPYVAKNQAAFEDDFDLDEIINSAVPERKPVMGTPSRSRSAAKPVKEPAFVMADPYVDEAEQAYLQDEPIEEEAPKTRTKRPKMDQKDMDKELSSINKSIAKTEPVRKYVRPNINLLSKGDPNAAGDSRAHLKEMCDRLQNTLVNFGVNARVTNVTCGPTVTQYEIQPEMGVKVSKIRSLEDDIKLNLAVPTIRIEAPIPGKAAVGIEVPNKENVTVAFRDLVESKEFKDNKSNISFCAGKDIAGNVIVADIAKMPHLLIAGSTGSGKSVCINTIIMSILFKADPEDVKLIMIDPKVVELSVYNGIPHLLIPVVTDPKKAAGALQWAVAEMTDRYQKFAEYGVRDIHGFNKKVESVADIEDENKPKKMPQMVVIVDELADLMMVASSDVEDAICRLAQLARAAGIHLIIATQRPSVNVITGLIKANMPSRIAFAVTSGIDSRTILDQNGAESLLGKGDMLFYPQGYSKPRRVQGAFVSDSEVADVVRDIIEKNGEVAYNADVENSVKNQQDFMGAGKGAVGDPNERDAYFTEAARFLIEKDKASIGALQRMYKIGFNRAARIMDQLEEAGIVGPEEGTKPRKILITLEEFENMCEEGLF